MDQSVIFGKIKLVYDEPIFKIVYDDVPKIIVNTLTGKITLGSVEGTGDIDLKCGDIDSETIKINDEQGFLFKNTRITDDSADTKIGIQDGEIFTEAISIDQASIKVSIAGEMEIGNDTQITGNLTLVNGDINNSGVNGGSVNTNGLTTSGTVSAAVLEASDIKGNDGTNPNCGEATLGGGTATVTVSTVLASDNSIILVTPRDSLAGTLYVSNIAPGSNFEISSTDPTDDGKRVRWLLINVK